MWFMKLEKAHTIQLYQKKCRALVGRCGTKFYNACRSVLKMGVAKPARCYKFVSWHTRRNVWVVQRRGCPAGLSSKCQHEAAKMAAKAFGLQVADLELRKIRAKAINTQPKPKQSKYLHVHWHARRCRWYVHVGRRFLGSFATERHAVSAVVKAGHASSAKELRLHKPVRAWRPRLTTKSSPARGLKMMGSAFLSAERFRDLWFLYRQASGSKGRGVLPGDLADALQHAKSNAFPIMTTAEGVCQRVRLAEVSSNFCIV